MPPDYQAANVLQYNLNQRADSAQALRLGFRIMEQLPDDPPRTKADSAALGKLMVRTGAMLYETQRYPAAASFYLMSRPYLPAVADSLRTRLVRHLGIAAWRAGRPVVACHALRGAALSAVFQEDSVETHRVRDWARYISERDSVFRRECPGGPPLGDDSTGVSPLLVLALCIMWLVLFIVLGNVRPVGSPRKA
ncbi:MAG: hypothetical protein GVY18_05200 [Bacteroidetes bacterium]|jgi:hypothetical protein|nr:hypothetical protein [Bacteroidota bacterium]